MSYLCGILKHVLKFMLYSKNTMKKCDQCKFSSQFFFFFFSLLPLEFKQANREVFKYQLSAAKPLLFPLLFSLLRFFLANYCFSLTQ